MAQGVKAPALVRFFEMIWVVEDGCWLWTGNASPAGYPFIWDGKTKLAHRWAYEQFIGPLVPGLEVDHLCKKTLCVNPKHLEQVSPVENLRRSGAASTLNSRKTHCKWGHEFTKENTYRHPKRGSRHCKTCARRRNNQKEG